MIVKPAMIVLSVSYIAIFVSWEVKRSAMIRNCRFYFLRIQNIEYKVDNIFLNVTECVKQFRALNINSATSFG